MEVSLAEYLTDNMKSSDGRPLLSVDIEVESTMMLYQPTEPSNNLRYVMPEERQDIIFYKSINSLPCCPLGYKLGTLCPKHAEFISEEWRFKDYTSKPSEKFATIIEKIPSSAVFEESKEEKPVGWILSYPSGHIGHLRILDKHQKKDLFKPLVFALCSKLLEGGYIPELASDNTKVIAVANRHGFIEISKGRRLIYKPSNQDYHLAVSV